MSALVLAALLAGTAPAAPAAPIVVSVRIEGDAADQARLTRFVEIKTGQPLDPELVRHVAELFYATGEYADVVVERRRPRVAWKWCSAVKAPLLDEVQIEGDRLLKPDVVRRWPASVRASRCSRPGWSRARDVGGPVAARLPRSPA